MSRPIRYWVRDGEEPFAVDLVEGEDGIAVTVGDRTFAVDLVRVGEGPTFSLLLAGRSVLFSARRESRKWTVTLGDVTDEVEVETDRARRIRKLSRAAGGGAGPKQVASDMAGIVVRVLVEPGQTVEPGAPVLILEAMKMQNEIRASGAGKVVTVHVEAGSTVQTGDRLVSFE